MTSADVIEAAAQESVTPPGVPQIEVTTPSPRACISAPQPFPVSFPYFIFRYYSHYVVRDVRGIVGNHLRLMLHTNGICILCVDPEHAVCQSGSPPIANISFNTKRGRNADLVDAVQRVKGKHKRNAVQCNANMLILTITLENQLEYTVPACVDGCVLEINTRIRDCPSLLSSRPLTDGYVAILNPRPSTRFEAFTLVSSSVVREALDGADE